MKLIYKLLAIAVITTALSCGEKPSAENKEAEWRVMADTIQYSVDIMPNDAEQPWAKEQVKQLDRQLLIDQLFESVYRHRARAYNFSDNRLLSLEEVKEMEINESHDRDLAARLHFWECWRYNAQGVLFEKKVLKVMIAYEARTEEGELKGYKAGVVIEMNQ